MGKKGLELVKIYAVVGLHDFIDRFCLVAFPVPDGETFIAIAPELRFFIAEKVMATRHHQKAIASKLVKDNFRDSFFKHGLISFQNRARPSVRPRCLC